MTECSVSCYRKLLTRLHDGISRDYNGALVHRSVLCIMAENEQTEAGGGFNVR